MSDTQTADSAAAKPDPKSVWVKSVLKVDVRAGGRPAIGATRGFTPARPSGAVPAPGAPQLGAQRSPERVQAAADLQKLRDTCLARWATLEAKANAATAAVGGLAPPIPAAATALGLLTTAAGSAKAAVEAKPEAWPNAVLKLDALQTAFDNFGISCLTEARSRATLMAGRLKTATAGDPVGGGQVKLRTACGDAQKKLAALIAGGDGLAALGGCAAAETATKALETAANPNRAARAKMVADAVVAVTGLTDEQLAAKPMAEKAALAFDLSANGGATGAALNQLTRLYRKSPPTPEFLASRDEERTKIADKVSKIPGVAKLIGNDGKVDLAEWNKITADPEKARVLLQAVNDEQMKVLGLPSVPVTTFDEPKTVTVNSNGSTSTSTSFGAYDPGIGEIDLNSNADALKSPKEALTTILHESFHAQQHALVKKLLAGELGPDDPLYPQVMMFAANFPPGYLPPSASQADYEAQPIEIDAETEGTKASVAVLLSVNAGKATI